ncbi:ATP-grasp fold amidoligase family protein [Salibaculum griseiflavum]|uniref:TupA-like ATPgrasp n=1 Tax=Salibaculum griseiflavum TaxID=1914409 RepID=A0A2V1P3P7_9RHOB|nr:ATP-grasp fold amidoligase family protein [Salibaculum griseiflavum]PWG17131.1 hypothetical protein DFK10_08820 [Salibaculum griseiflavum]
MAWSTDLKWPADSDEGTMQQFPTRQRSQVPLIDRAFHWVSFLKRHRRLPDRSRKWVSDLIYDQMTSGRNLDPVVQLTSDKEHVKAHVDAVLGPGHTIPTHAILRTADEIDTYDFTSGTFVKPTHMSSKVAQGDSVDRSTLNKWLRRNFYYRKREHQYRYLTPKIIVEPLVFDGAPFREFKFYVLRGRSRLGFEVRRSPDGQHFLMFGRDLSVVPYDSRFPAPEHLDPPTCLEAMWDAAEKLGTPFHFVRVDMMTDGERYVINELTHSEGAGRYRYRSRRHPNLASEQEVSALLFGDAD